MQTDTDTRELWAYRTVAELPDRTGKHRVSFVAFSDLYAWSPEERAETMGRAMNATEVGPLSRAEYDAILAGEHKGYAASTAPDAPVEAGDWVSMA